MNNQVNSMHPHYTLPGVMHYLQMEFTRNERDRIAWELERSEMKARIAQLEGENKDMHYRLMKLKNPKKSLDTDSDLAFEENGADLTTLMKSKMAVQDNVKEIIYLFKSPNITTQLRSLNEKKDSVHELERLNLNQSITNVGDNINVSAADIPNDLHQARALQEAMDDRSVPHAVDADSDAATVVMKNEVCHETYNDVRPHRSSSLFTPAKVAPVEVINDRDGVINTGDGDTKKSSTLVSNESQDILQLKAFKNQLIVFSKNGHLNLWHIDNSFKCGDLPVKNFDGVSNLLLDIYWLDMGRFLILDDVGIKLFTAESETPASQIVLFENKEASNKNEKKLEFSDIIHHDFKNNAVLLVTAKKIMVIETSVSTKDTQQMITEIKRLSIPVERNLLAAKFGMTEKSLIVLHDDPYEVVIYNFHGKVLQRVNLNIPLLADLDKTAMPTIHLNKKSSKMLIEFQKILLVYSFDQKKIVMKYTLNSQPTDIIFTSVNDYLIIAYEDGSIEIRNLSNFDTIIDYYDTFKNDQRLADTKITAMDSTMINSTTVIITGGKFGELELDHFIESKN